MQTGAHETVLNSCNIDRPRGEGPQTDLVVVAIALALCFLRGVQALGSGTAVTWTETKPLNSYCSVPGCCLVIIRTISGQTAAREPHVAR